MVFISPKKEQTEGMLQRARLPARYNWIHDVPPDTTDPKNAWAGV